MFLEVSNPALHKAGPAGIACPGLHRGSAPGLDISQPLLTTCCFVHSPAQQTSSHCVWVEFHAFHFVPVASCPGTTEKTLTPLYHFPSMFR